MKKIQNFVRGSRGIFLLRILLFVIVLFSANIMTAQKISRVGTSAASFLKIGVGARAMAMGEAFTTQAHDVTSMYWNPSGLAMVKEVQIFLNHYNYFADLTFDYGAIAFSLGSVGNIGFHISYLGMPDIERTTEIEPMGNGEKVSAFSFAAGFSYARSLTERFYVGGTIKYIQENLWHTSASNVGFDVGLLYRAEYKNLLLGMSIANFGGKMQLTGRDLLVQVDTDPLSAGNNSNVNATLKTDQFNLPLIYRVGIGANIGRDFLGLQKHDFIIAIDAVHPSDDFEYLNIGAEYSFKKMVFLRSGFRKLFLEDSEGGLTFGLGLHFFISNYDFYLDYAAVDLGRFDYLNKFSLIFAIK